MGARAGSGDGGGTRARPGDVPRSRSPEDAAQEMAARARQADRSVGGRSLGARSGDGADGGGDAGGGTGWGGDAGPRQGQGEGVSRGEALEDAGPERLRPAEALRLFRRARAGDRAARQRLVTANINLVHHLVQRYRAMWADGADDLFQVGCVGLIKAVDRFDPELGYRFSTYAVPVILGEIQRYLRDAAPAGIGRGALRVAQAARRAEARLSGELLRQPTAAEVAEAIGVSPGELAAALEAARRPASLDAGDGREAGDRPLLLRIAGGGALGEGGDGFALRTLLARLPVRERQVVLLRFYLDRSQAEVGLSLGLSQPQISRLEKRALGRLREWWSLEGEGDAAPQGGSH